MKIYSVQLQFMKNKKALICEICDNKEKCKKNNHEKLEHQKSLTMDIIPLYSRAVILEDHEEWCHHRSICRAMIF